jgi:hypothetical protein
MANLKTHAISFFIYNVLLAVICIVLQQYGRIFAITFNIFFLDPDNDQFGKGKIHRWFYSHSFCPALWIWWGLSDIVPNQYWLFIWLAFGSYTFVHLIGDLGTNQGYSRIKLYPIKKSINPNLWIISQILLFVGMLLYFRTLI